MPDHGQAGRALVTLVVLLLLAAAAAAWWYFAPESLPGPLRAWVPQSPRAAPLLYEWHDARGRLHVTDTPPKDRPYKTLHVNPNVNVVPNVLPPGSPPPRHDD